MQDNPDAVSTVGWVGQDCLVGGVYHIISGKCPRAVLDPYAVFTREF